MEEDLKEDTNLDDLEEILDDASDEEDEDEEYLGVENDDEDGVVYDKFDDEYDL